MLFPVSQLIDVNGSVTCVRRDALVRDALRVMVEHDFSQLPIVDTDGDLLAMITEQSIISTYFHTAGAVPILDLTVDNCQTRPHTLHMEEDISEALDQLENTYAIVIIDGRKPKGILTAYDATHFFRGLSEGLIFIEDIEVTLRRYIDAAFPDEHSMQAALIRAFREDKQDPSKPRRPYEELSFGEHIQLITTMENWGKFSVYLEPKELFVGLMGQVGQIRNQLAHFRGRMEPLQHDALERARDWLASRPRPAGISAKEITVQPMHVSGTPNGTAKYPSLREWLQEQQAAGETNISLQINGLSSNLQEALPPSAFTHRSWWANDYSLHSNSKAWLDAGWLVDDVRLEEGTVVFRASPSALYPGFFAGMVQQLRQKRPTYTQARKTSLENWMTLGSGISGCTFNWVLPKEGAAGGVLRVELYIDVGDKDRNKEIFDALKDHEREIETALGTGLNWERLDHRKASRISTSIPFRLSAADPEEIREAQSWGAGMILKFVDVFTPYLRNLR